MPSTLLLADDSVTIQRVIELTFADEDVRVVAVSDGAAAIEMLATTPPDIVLADAEMPGRNGYEVARHIRDTPGLAHIPVLLLKGAFEPIDEGRAAAVGCDGVLEKPFEPQLVIAKVKELLTRGGKPQAPEELPEEPAFRAHPGALEEWPETPSVPLTPVAPLTQEAARPKRAEFDTYLDRLDAALEDMPLGGRGRGAESKGAAAQHASEALPPADPAPPAAVMTTPPATPAFPPLAEAFTALLAAEQSSTEPPLPATWPVGPIAGVHAGPPPISDDLVDQVTRRVLDHMSDRVVRETVNDLVARLAERLVREEIARLKNAVPRRGDAAKE